MHRIIDYARGQGIGEIFGDVLRENSTMLAICERLGFGRSVVEDDASIVRVTLRLDPCAPA
jgi:acetyltransferase